MKCKICEDNQISEDVSTELCFKCWVLDNSLENREKMKLEHAEFVKQFAKNPKEFRLTYTENNRIIKRILRYFNGKVEKKKFYSLMREITGKTTRGIDDVLNNLVSIDKIKTIKKTFLELIC